MKKTNELTAKNTADELVSLNDELYTEFGVQELEQRLETDPLMFANLLSGAEAACDFDCGSLHDCKNLCPDKCIGQCNEFDIIVKP